MGALQLDGRYGYMAGEDRRVIALGIDLAGYRFLVEPIIDPPARVGPFLEHGPRDFPGLTREAHSPCPIEWNIYVKKDAGGQAFIQDKAPELVGEPGGMVISESIPTMSKGNRESRDVVDDGLGSRAHRAGIEDVLAKIGPSVDS